MPTGEVKSVMDDDREISSLLISEQGWRGVGSDGVTAVKVYKEAGEMAYVAWFAIYYGEEMNLRVNGKFVIEVNYAASRQQSK